MHPAPNVPSARHGVRYGLRATTGVRRNVRSPLVRSIIESQIALFFFLAVSIVIEPNYLLSRDEGGLSNFGVHGTTVVPYTLAFLLCAMLVARSASLVDVVDRMTRQFKTMLVTLSWLLLLVLASTYGYKTSQLLHNAHIAVGVVMLCFESAASIWIVVALAREPWSLLALGVQLIGFILAALTFFGQLHLLFVAQLLTSLAFGALLIRSAQIVDVTVEIAG
jgi:hypothetical protein